MLALGTVKEFIFSEPDNPNVLPNLPTITLSLDI
jgi:hypothetical protein